MISFISVLSRITVICAVLLFPSLLAGQTTNLNGIINVYTPVTFIDTTRCPVFVTVANTAGLNESDWVLIIQMKGAQFDTSNTSSFGNVINLNGAGNYEIAKIVNIMGNTIKLNGKLTNKYDVNGKVQLIKIPEYINANVTGVLTCQPWNGTTGGVLVFRVQNNLQLNADIDVSGRGFRGGNISTNPDGSCGGTSAGYHYPLYQPGLFSWVEGGAQKGEGICEIDTPRLAGRGPLINGGGGANKHNTGGGGGSNFTAGGKGGNELAGCSVLMNGGLGGNALSSYYSATDKLFAGGGGGCGDYNNAVGSNGENGGGIAIIMCSSITGNNFKILANGNDVTVIGSGIADGGGGGGAGGSVFLEATSIVNPFSFEADGGRGGDQNPSWGCVGPGGGGGTGTFLTNLPSLPGIPYSLAPGNAGLFLASGFSCSGTSYGAMPGIVNSTGPLTGRSLVYTQDSTTSCIPLSVIDMDQTGVSFTVYPDPANSFIKWKTAHNEDIFSDVKIVDYLGKIVYESNEKVKEINIEKLAAGVYILQVADESVILRRKFIKN